MNWNEIHIAEEIAIMNMLYKYSLMSLRPPQRLPNLQACAIFIQ